MSKGHQANRRRAYGRRRHEVRERIVREPDLAVETIEERSPAELEPFRLLDLDFGVAGFRLVAGD
jgi:hypothetical protein